MPSAVDHIGGPACEHPRMAMRVGIDLVSVDAVRQSIDEHGERYLKRIYTDTELDDCRLDEGFCAERLAARFAAKEAALKVLRPQDEAVPWRTLNVVRHGAGWLELELSGRAAALAADAGLSGFSLSISHEQGYASAVVIAELDLRNGAGRPMMDP
jgi:holo-[acyl-carrier protein] synthase